MGALITAALLVARSPASANERPVATVFEAPPQTETPIPPVPAHDVVAINLPGKRGVYMAESYKADLCPNMGASQAPPKLSSWDNSQTFSATLSPH